MNTYRKRILAQIAPLVESLGPLEKILDFGCGDGWFSSQIQQVVPDVQLTSLDVKLRKNVMIEPVIYAPGDNLPFADTSFDLAYAIDVLHHCDSPHRYLDELARVASRYILIKDHTYNNRLDYLTLAVFDELGNRRFGIPTPQHYQRGDEWTRHLEARGWVLRRMLHPCNCHAGWLGRASNHLQYMALYERGGLAEEKLQSR